MDIAVTGLAPIQPLGENRGRQPRAQAEQPNQPRNQSDQTDDSAREEQAIRSEAFRRSRVNPNQTISSTQRSLAERSSIFNQNSRQFSVPAAIQAFRENEALIAPQGVQRQVSGIIDEFV